MYGTDEKLKKVQVMSLEQLTDIARFLELDPTPKKGLLGETQRVLIKRFTM